ncbi:tyrosine-protein phosphatase [Ramlibacter sp.]|uniref:protein-tyrosine phosphatase family protein n=1 Tax=Ramlibacter sp. TaxID=1917967 RepID=UPI0035B35794
MPFRSVRLPDEVPGQLWLGPMPGRFEPWSAFMADAEHARLGLVVCLTPRDELAQLSPAYHRAVAGPGLGFRWLHTPMRNFGLPEDSAAFRRDMAEVTAALHAGDAVLLHCAAGIGRTGSAAACVLKSLGLPTDEALARVRAAGSNPQNAEQSGLVGWF